MTAWYGGEEGGHIGFSPIAPLIGRDAMRAARPAARDGGGRRASTTSPACCRSTRAASPTSRWSSSTPRTRPRSRSAYEVSQRAGQRGREARLRRVPRAPELHGSRRRAVLVGRPRLPALLRDAQGRARPERDPRARQAGDLAALDARATAGSAAVRAVAVAEDRRLVAVEREPTVGRRRARRCSRSPTAGSAAPTCTSATCPSCSRRAPIPGHELSGRIVALGDGRRGLAARRPRLRPAVRAVRRVRAVPQRRGAGLPARESRTASGSAPGGPGGYAEQVDRRRADALRAARLASTTARAR